MVRLALTTLRFLVVLALTALLLASAPNTSDAAPAPGGFAGTWTIEQIPPGGTPRRQGTLTVTQNGGALAGTMRLDGRDVPLSNVRESGGIISFSAPAAGSPGLMLNYSGAIQGNQLGVASQELGSGSYTVTARRTRGAPQAQVAQTAPATPPAPASASPSPALRAPAAPAAPQAQVAQTAPTTPPAAAPAPPQAARAPTAPAAPPPAPRAPAAPTLGRPGATAQGDYVARLLGQTAPAAPAPSATPPPPAQPPQIVASAPPSAPAPATPPQSAPVRRPTEPPRPPGPDLEGNWSAEQTTPGSVGPSAATRSFTREGNRVAGVLLSDGQEFPLFDVRQVGSEVTFSVVIPGTPYETVLYRGMVSDDRMELAGRGEQQGVYALTATRQGPSAAAAPPPAPSEPAPVEPAPMPQVALAPPPREMPVAAAPSPPTAPQPPPQVALAPPPPEAPVAAPPPPPTPEQPPTPPAASGSLDATLQGTWVVELTDSGLTSTIQATLAFDGDKASLRVGSEDLPLYEVTQVGADLAFTVIVPGTPYMSVRYSGVVADGMMQLTSLDAGRGVSTLQARRIDESAMPAAGPAAPPMQASPPTPIARPAPPPRTPSPASARPVAQPPSAAPSAPAAKLPLPVLRDLPPDGLAMTPIMGWSSRQKLGSRTDDATIRQAVEGLVESGLHLIGYVYVEIGDGWQGERDTERVLHPNERFPDMKALGDYIHSQGLKFGLTASVAPKSCNGFKGSYGHEAQDARTLAEWGVDYVVFEWCGAEGIDYTQEEMRAAFQLMGEALRTTGRDIVYAIRQKDQYGVEQWGAKTGAHIWRSTPNEIDENWASIAEAGFGQNGKESAAKPGSWNDPGLLQAGNTGLTIDEARMQLNLWAVLAAPMMLGNDVRIMMRETVALLSNRELIGINQDKLGRQGKRIAQSGDTQVWARPLTDGSLAVAFFNTGPRTISVAVTWEQLGIEGPRLARDLWWHENLGIANNGYRVVLAGGTSMLLKLSR